MQDTPKLLPTAFCVYPGESRWVEGGHPGDESALVEAYPLGVARWMFSLVASDNNGHELTLTVDLPLAQALPVLCGLLRIYMDVLSGDLR